MNKSCDNCYWRPYGEQWCINKVEEPKEKLCDKHRRKCEKCEDDMAVYEYKNKQYCQDCLFEEFGVETYQVTHYTVDGEYLGSEDEMEEVISNLSKGIKGIDCL